jgi:multicomponent Na+:H+ antiporter subunit A
LNGLALGQTRLLQSGYLRYYLLIVLVTAVGLVGATLVGRGSLVGPANWWDLHFYEAGVVVLILLATLVTVLARSRLAAIAALGVVGYGVAIVFVLFGAPDLAMTQFLVETLTVILFVLVFYHLPESQLVSRALHRVRDAMVAVAVGLLMSALVLIAADAHYYPSISAYFSEHSLSEGHGRNIVNVILVDFRGLDTLGEMTVLAVAGIGVYALLKLRPNKDGSAGASPAELARVPSGDGLPQDEQSGEGRSVEGTDLEVDRSLPASGGRKGDGR